MKILVLCETSNEVAGRFRAQGHDVTSCDLLPNDVDQSNHWQGDVMTFLETIADGSIDLIIAHPECTAMAVSGNAWYGKAMAKENKRKEALDWTENLWNVCKRQSQARNVRKPCERAFSTLGKASIHSAMAIRAFREQKNGIVASQPSRNRGNE